jgi:hypothetical protein
MAIGVLSEKTNLWIKISLLFLIEVVGSIPEHFLREDHPRIFFKFSGFY